MKSAVETLSPTRVRLTVEVPFDELKPSLDAAYRKIAKQVRIQGFRPGKVPPRVLDQRVGRGVVLEEAVQEAVPKFYGDAVRENDVAVLGHPEVEVSDLADGDHLTFTAEVDVRPAIDVPDYHGLPVTVADVDVTDADVDQQLAGLRERFATLTAVERAAESGDYVTLDLRTTVDDEEVPGGTTTGLSYEIGSANLMPGLDEALIGLSAEESRTFQTGLLAGEFAGRTVEVTATVRGVKAKELPELDDEFAETASEFDSIAELRADVAARLERVKRLEQGVEARDKVLEVLLERTDVPLPAAVVATEVDWRRRSMDEQLTAAGLSRSDYLASEGQTEEEFDAEVARNAETALRAQFVLDAIATTEEVGVSEGELTDMIVQRARRAEAAPEDYARQLVENGALSGLMAEIVRGKALAVVLESAAVTDASGRPVDLSALREPDEDATVEAGTGTGDPGEATAEETSPASPGESPE